MNNGTALVTSSSELRSKKIPTNLVVLRMFETNWSGEFSTGRFDVFLALSCRLANNIYPLILIPLFTFIYILRRRGERRIVCALDCRICNGIRLGFRTTHRAGQLPRELSDAQPRHYNSFGLIVIQSNGSYRYGRRQVHSWTAVHSDGAAIRRI